MANEIGEIAYDLVTNPHQIKASVYHSTRDVDSGSIVLNGIEAITQSLILLKSEET